MPLAGASVDLENAQGEHVVVSTGADGSWKFQGLPPGRYKITIASSGFKPIKAEEEVVAGSVTELTYRLSLDEGGIEITVQGQRPPREVTRRTIEQREIARIPGTSGDALRSLAELARRGAPAGARRSAHRARIGSHGYAYVHRRHLRTAHLPLRRALFGDPHRDAREDRLLSRQFQRAIRPRDGRCRRSRRALAQDRRQVPRTGADRSHRRAPACSRAPSRFLKGWNFHRRRAPQLDRRLAQAGAHRARRRRDDGARLLRLPGLRRNQTDEPFVLSVRCLRIGRSLRSL